MVKMVKKKSKDTETELLDEETLKKWAQEYSKALKFVSEKTIRSLNDFDDEDREQIMAYLVNAFHIGMVAGVQLAVGKMEAKAK